MEAGSDIEGHAGYRRSAERQRARGRQKDRERQAMKDKQRTQAAEKKGREKGKRVEDKKRMIRGWDKTSPRTLRIRVREGEGSDGDCTYV